jgi:acyl-CoA thioesterase-2
LRAAELTVPDDRAAHSVHATFIRAGSQREPITFVVTRERDGRSFSTRQIDAVQFGETILQMLASFHIRDGGPQTGLPMADVPPPETLFEVPGNEPPGTESLRTRDYPVTTLSVPLDQAPARRSLDSVMRTWSRSTEAWPNGLAFSASYVTYLADLRTGLAALDEPDGPFPADLAMTSLDHSLWFHDQVSPEEWLLIDMRRIAFEGDRALVLGTVHARDGRHVATLTQELLARRGAVRGRGGPPE